MLSFKALHIIAVVVWFSGLFYIGRLFVYHQEANQRGEVERQVLKPQFALMEKRLWYAITWPGMIGTVITGLMLLYYWGIPGWIHAKLILVAVLLGYHGACGSVRRQLLSDRCSWSSRKLRMFNEIPSLLLVTIVFAVVLKEQLSWPILLLGIAGLAMVIMGAAQLYAKVRKRRIDTTSS